MCIRDSIRSSQGQGHILILRPQECINTNQSKESPRWCGYSWTVWVTMAWLWHFLNQHGTGAPDSEGIRHETDTGNGWEVINWVSTWWGIMGRGPVAQILVRPKVTLSQTSRLFIDLLYIAAVVIVRSVNSQERIWLCRKFFHRLAFDGGHHFQTSKIDTLD